ncbi:MAG: BatD family protein [Chitinophagaceae bacterium]|nr:BatD family protein [Chitinophagaceae bacterium]
MGEGVMVTYKFYSRINTTSQVLKRPSLTGFSVVEMVDAYESKPDIEIYNGQRYYVNLVRKVQLFPLQAGKFELEPALKEVYNKYVFPLQGYKSFEYSFTAPDSGSVVIPAANFHYFNPATKVYQAANSNPVTLTILPAIQKPAPPLSTETNVVDDSSIPRQLYWFAIVAVLIVSWIVFQIIRVKEKQHLVIK